MSMYGPPGGPYPGQPQDPWQSGQPQDPYGQQDPYGPQQPSWGQQDQWGGSGSAQPGSPGPYGAGGYGQTSAFPQDGGYPPPPGGGYGQPGYDPFAPQPPVKKKGSGALIAVIVVLAVLLCGGGAAGLYYYTTGNDKKTDANSSTGPTSGPSGDVTSSAPGKSSPSTNATGGSTDARTAKVGDCLINEGTSDNPSLKKASCAAGTFEVLKRFDGTSDVKKCEGVPNYTHNYYFKTSTETSSFVLCMKIR